MVKKITNKKTPKRKHEQKDYFTAKLSFWFGIFSWIPLFNFGLSFAAAFFGIKAIRRIISHPDKFGGKWYAIIGMIIGVSVFVSSVVFLAVYLVQKMSCTQVCSMF